MSKIDLTKSWQIFNKDCVEKLLEVQADSVDLAFCDPPFNIGYEYNVYEDNKEAEDYRNWCRDWMLGLRRVLSETGSFWLAIGDEFVSELDMTAKSLGFIKRSHVVWWYSFGVANTHNFSRSHTHLLYYTMDHKHFTFNKDDPRVRVPSNRQLVYNDPRANPNGKLPDNTWALTKEMIDQLVTEDPWVDTWFVSRVAGTFKEREDRGKTTERKGTPQMPLPVLERIVLACSNPGDMVLDPMCGTGTTLAAAVKHGRRAIGMDIDPECCNSGAQRLKKIAVAPQEAPPCPAQPKPPKKSLPNSTKPSKSKSKSGSEKTAST